MRILAVNAGAHMSGAESVLLDLLAQLGAITENMRALAADLRAAAHDPAALALREVGGPVPRRVRRHARRVAAARRRNPHPSMSSSPRPRLAKGLGRLLRGTIHAVLLAYCRA